MKKILNILFIASLLAVSCTKEVKVSREHDLDAEVTEITTAMEMSVLYCNINDAADSSLLDLQKVGEYLTAKAADVVTLVAPATVNGTKFSTWLTAYATENAKTALFVENTNGALCMGALVSSDYSVESYEVAQLQTFNNAVLHFKANDTHFVVTDLLEARNEIPSDWYEQIQAMVTAKKESPIVYDPDNLAKRKVETQELIKRTMEYKDKSGERPFAKDSKWIWCVDMNVPSSLDMKFGKQFARKDCYDWNEDTEDYFIHVESAYFTTPSEFLSATDPYFAAHDVMVKEGGLVDCFAVLSSYMPSSVSLDGNYLKERNNFLYASNGCWNMFETLTLDTAIVSEWGTTHYPIMVTLKSEE